MKGLGFSAPVDQTGTGTAKVDTAWVLDLSFWIELN